MNEAETRAEAKAWDEGLTEGVAQAKN